MNPRRLRDLILTFLMLAGHGGLRGQSCPEGHVDSIVVDNRSVFDTEAMGETARFLWAYRLANTIHMDTSEDFIRDEILFEPGDCYDEEILEESERLLRLHPFIAQSDVSGVRQADGSWQVVVKTQDEWTTKLNVKVRLEEGFEFSGVDLTEENFFGRGHLVGFFFRQRDEKRYIGGRVFTPRLFGSRLDADIEAGSTRVGSFFSEEFVYPFVGEVGRFAGRQFFLRRDEIFPYSIGTGSVDGFDDASHVLLSFEKKVMEVTLAGRIGDPGDLTVFGLGVSDESVEFGDHTGSVEVAENADFGAGQPAPPEVEALVADQRLHTAGPQFNLLLGQRNIRFVQRTGLDALRGVQDVQVGTDIGVTIGRSIGFLTDDESETEALTTRLRAFAGTASGPFVANLAAAFEARQLLSSGQGRRGWRNLIGEADAVMYWQPPGTGHTLFARVAAAGGWQMILPFQLTLGGPGGLRGFLLEDFPGARRVIATVEDRLYVPWPFPEHLDFGFSLFADAGKVWAGDVPFGVSTGWKGTVGGGLRMGFPSGTRGVIRVDVGVPLGSGSTGSGPVFRVSFDDLIGLAAGLSDRQLNRSRLSSVGPDLFTPRR